MERILVWGLGRQYNQYINVIKYYEMLGEVEVVGITDEEALFKRLDGYPFVPIAEIDSDSIDYVVVTSGKNFHVISEQARTLGFSKKQLIMAKVFCIPGFRLDRYIELLNSEISIIANSCWGGIVYNALGMERRSPFVNMFLHEKDYCKLLNNLQYYLNFRLQFDRYEYEAPLQRNYPVCKLEDVELHFNHATTMDEVEEKWYERVERINWDNLFVMMIAKTQDSLERFEQLSYKKKACFVPFESKLPSAVSLNELYNEEKCGEQMSFWAFVNSIPRGFHNDFDLIEMLLTGRINHNRSYI